MKCQYPSCDNPARVYPPGKMAPNGPECVRCCARREDEQEYWERRTHP